MILDQIRSGSGIVVATVIQTAGSTPQKPGSSAIFGEHGLLAGTVGGGLLEGEVQQIAESVLISGISDHYYFNLDNDHDSEGAICGGEARVLVDADPAAHLSCLEKMELSLSRREEGFLLTLVGQNHEQGKTIRRYWINDSLPDHLPAGMDPAFRNLVGTHMKQAVRLGFTGIDLSTVPDHQIEIAFLEHCKPVPRLIIAGGGHVGKALAHLASLLEFDVSVVDDRPEFASKVHISDANHLLVKDMGEELKS